MAFGKPGRPRKDRLQVQQQIYEAAIPLIRRDGVRKLAMRDVARAAAYSIGALYYYFPTKRHLVLHGVRGDARERLCRVFHQRLQAAGGDDAERMDAYLDLSVHMLRFVQPAVLAALEYGRHDFQEQLNEGLEQNLEELREVLLHTAPAVRDADLATLGASVRRLALGTVVDARADFEGFREQLRLLIEGALSRAAARPAAPTAAAPTQSG